MRVLVTGGAGFIGSAVIRHLIQEEPEAHHIFNIDKLTYAGCLTSLESVQDNPLYCFRQIDVCDGPALRAVFDEFQPQTVVHLAAESHVDRSVTGAGDFVNTNIIGTFTLLEEARRYWSSLSAETKAAFRFVHVSTDEVYGSLGAEGMFDETSPYDPSSPYSASKAAADHLARAWHRTYGLPVIVTNCSNNYGPYQFPEKLIPLTVLNALHGRPLTVYGNGVNVRDWLHVEDHARALVLITRSGIIGQTYGVGGRSERRNIDVVRDICAAVDKLRPEGAPHSRLITFVADRPGHDARYAIDASKLEGELGWKPRENFDSGIAKTVKWYLDNEWWWQPLATRYDGSRLGLLDEGKNKQNDGKGS